MNKRIQKRLFLCLLIVFVLGTLFFWYTKKILSEMNSDFAAELILGNLIAQNGIGEINRWYFSTEVHLSLLTIFSSIFFHFSNNWVLVNILSNITSVIVCVLLTFYLCRLLGINKTICIGISLFFSIPISNLMVYYYFICNEYLTYWVFEVLFLSFYFQWEKNQKRYSIILTCLWVAILGMMGERYVLAVIAPFMLTVMYSIYLKRKLDFKQLLICFCGLGSFIISKFTINQIFNFSGATPWHFVSITECVDRGILSLSLIAKSLGYKEETNIFSIRGISCVLALLFMALLVFSLINCAQKINKQKIENKDFFVIFSINALILNFCALLFCGQDGIMWDVRAKYYFLSIFNLVLICGLFIQINYKHYLMIVLIFLFAIMLQFYNTYKDDTANEHVVSGRADKVIEYMLENDIKYGYATFWNANMIYYLSNGEIKVTSIKNDNEYTEIERWLTSDTIVNTIIDNNDESFLLLTVSELNSCESMELSDILYRDEYYVLFRMK